MMNIKSYFIMLISFLFLLSMILYYILYKSIIDREKMSPFECGFDPFESSRIPFSSHLFMIAVIFLIFDVELTIIMPVIIMMSNMNIMYMYNYMFIFIHVNFWVISWNM